MPPVKGQYFDVVTPVSGKVYDKFMERVLKLVAAIKHANPLDTDSMMGAQASKEQYAYWKHTQLIIDVIEGHGGTFSLEGPEGKAFHTRSRVFTVEEQKALGLC